METKADLLAKLREIEMAEEEAERRARCASEQQWKELAKKPETYEWRTKPCKYTEFLGNETFEACAVERRVKPELLQYAVTHEENSWIGMVYFRTNEGILTRGGGGHVVLRDPMLCNDEEWQAILSGKIPAKYMKFPR